MNDSNDAPRYEWAKTDCRHYVGEKPCKLRKTGCEGCEFYDPMGARVLVIKLAAMGDVIRTTPILDPIRARHERRGERCHVTWVVDAPTAPLLKGIPGIDNLIAMDGHTATILAAQKFDEVYCLDKEPRAIALGAAIPAPYKKGFTMTPYGTLGVCDDDAAYALRLGVDDPFKFLENTRTYQDIIFEVAGFKFADEPVRLGIGEAEREYGRAHLAQFGVGPFVGVNTGAGKVFATKRLSEEQTAELCRAIRDELGATPVLLGGRDEADRNARILALSGGAAVDGGTSHGVRDFAGVVGHLAALVCVDTLAMHLAVAQQIPVVVLFGPTCPQEVHLYGHGEKYISAPWCAPCYKGACDHHTCMREIETSVVMEKLRRVGFKDAAKAAV
ncbi:MAG: glycosyltransferase family 9 protein [Deltaproteobacteria bacterium]|nr:glycosyltransferase family 9 protein [Deltaproteobacteria bacterium]MCB9479738.1 glycosyltransferase family 9 protein [Deltaproteobacteria bacterium]MCB9487508.1 glycosyltransferase family 9 protein [Deltaproteobacteria bacterium]